MPIYTRTGDKGTTSLFSGKRVLKSSARVDSYGTIDELNSILGIIAAYLHKKTKATVYLRTITHDIQKTLFYIGSHLADLPDAIEDIDLPDKTKQFEHYIDEMTDQMPPLNNFILPGGGIVGAYFQHARTVARRAERCLVRLSEKEKVDTRVIAYINRLSDLLFTMSRYANFKEKKKEVVWER